ncbi:glycosyltransferase [Acidovorax sp. NCPPB 4044]|uniref:glycosyltransferase n=1 Tax=Acidovorax sp. NCPPB 4044 TaxID=2940490 RepID=UPI0023049CBA|nr:glycosyltransferase [Acidovorax sp. NCPPB 4044]MDA8519459.1 glycosyltransferase [Acidovorax sp. NCPPB 4044]
MVLRVLHVGKFFPPYRGGMEVFLSDLVAAQRAQGIDASALVHGTPLPYDPPWLERVPVQFQLVYAPFALGFRAALARAIRRFRPDVLHLHMPNNSALWALTLPSARKIPWVVHWHSDVVVSEIKLSVALAYALYRPFEHALLDGAERVIATSPPYLKASRTLQYWRSKCVVAPLGIDLEALPPPAACNDWSPGTALRLLSIGRLTYYKGFETLIQAVAALPGVELLIVGDGELRANLQARIQAARASGPGGTVRLLGDVDDAQKHALLASCDVFCLASRERTEAFGVVLLEAMFHARPCIVTDLPGSGMPWLVAHAKAGLRVPIEDVEGWTAAITRLRHDPPLRQRLGTSGRQALLKSFDIRSSAQAIEREYRHITSKPRPSAQGKGLLAVITTRNDAGSIGALVASLRQAGMDAPLVVDHRSTDGTCLFAERAGAKILRPLIPMSAWEAVQTGMRYALSKGYSGVVTVPGDHFPGPEGLQPLLQHAEQADVVVIDPASAHGPHAPWWGRIARMARSEPPRLGCYSRAAVEALSSREAALLDDAELGLLWLRRSAQLRVLRLELPLAQGAPALPRTPPAPWWSLARRLALLALFRFAVVRSRPVRASPGD